MLARCSQPVEALHESSVHGLPSLQVPSSVRPLQLSSMPLQTSGTTCPGWQLAVQTLPPPPAAAAQMPVAQSASTLQGQPSCPPQLLSGPTSAVSPLIASGASTASAMSGNSRSRSTESEEPSFASTSLETVSPEIRPSITVSPTTSPSWSAISSPGRLMPSIGASSVHAVMGTRKAIVARKLIKPNAPERCFKRLNGLWVHIKNSCVGKKAAPTGGSY